MQRINGTNITLTKGDTLRATVTMTRPDGTVYTPQEGDVIRFAMKREYTDATPSVMKVIPNDTLLLKLDSSDTKNLTARKYVYDIQLTYANGDVDTFIDRASLTLTEEVE